MDNLSSENEQPNSVTLACAPEDFERFIKSLLGKPQTITNHFEGEFDLEREDLEQFHYLLKQRIEQQNKASLIQFTARIVYSDDSTVLINDFTAFSAYNEPKPLRSVAVHLSWEFLVEFEDRSTPEKQEIDVSFVTGPSRPILDKDHSWFIAPFAHPGPGMVAFRVSHTARSWASDIEALLSGHIRSLIHDKSKIRTWLSNHEGRIGVTIFCTLLIGTIVAMFFLGESVRRSTLTAVQEVESLAETNDKMDAVALMVASGDWPRFAVHGVSFFVLVIVAALGLSIWASSMADARSPAFITLTKKSEEYRAKMLARSRNRFILFFLSLLVSIVAGVAGNWVFAYFIQGWRP